MEGADDKERNCVGYDYQKSTGHLRNRRQYPNVYSLIKSRLTPEIKAAVLLVNKLNWVYYV